MNDNNPVWACGNGHRVATSDDYCRSCWSEGEAAYQLLWRFVWAAIALAVVSAIAIAASWPGVVEECGFRETDCFVGEPTGSQGGLVFGWLLFGVADILMVIAVVGFGARLGARASRFGK